MKASNKKILITVISFLFVLLLAVMPMTAFAEVGSYDDKVQIGGSTSTYGAYVYSKGVDISPLDGDFSEETVYTMTVSHSRTAISSFQMSFRMPYFVDVKNVYASDVLLNNADTAIFEWHMDEKGYVNVSYSSPYSVAETDLFTVEFTLNNTATAYENVECVYSEFVDEGAKTVNAEVDLGYVSIGVAEIVVMGDVNGDKIVNLADLLIIQRSIVNKGYVLTDEQLAVADINRDGEISMIDCQYIQNFLVGKIDSLENISSATYNIDVLITDQNGNWLYNGSFAAKSGELYSDYMTPIFMSLSKQYNIIGNISIESDVYGTVDPDSNGEGFAVKDKDYIVMTVNVNYGSEEEKIYVAGSDLLPNELTVPVGTSSEELIKTILSDVNIVLYLSDGSTCEVALTEDMIDLSNVVLDVDGYYSVLVNYYSSEFDYDVTNSIQLHVTPDTSKWQHLGTFTFVCDGYNGFGWETFDFYTEAVIINGEEFCEWTANENGVVSVSQEGVTVLMQLDEQNKTISFYKPNDALIGTYTYSEGDMTMTFAVYGQYGGASEYVACITQTMVGDGGVVVSASFTTFVQLDLENSILYPAMMRREFIINDDNSLTVKECEHEWQYNTQAPTCTTPGWENQYCNKCGEGMGHEIPALGHSVNADGYCGNCGEYVNPSLDDEFIAYRQERMATVKADWYNTLKRYPEAAEIYQIRFDRLYSIINNATTYDEVNRSCDELYNVMNEIHEKFGSSVETDYIVGAYTSAYPAEVMQYSSVDEYLSQIVGIDAYIDCSLSGRHIITVTYDMFRSIENLDFSVVGNQFFFVYCEIEGVGGINIQMNVTVKPDMESAEALGTYTVSSDIISIPWSEVTFYSNGIAVFSTGEACTYTVNDNGVYRISYVQSMPGLEIGSIETILLMVVDDSTKVISYYLPTEPAYRTFYYTEGIYMTITLYGDYIGSGEYIAVLFQEAKMSDGTVMKNEATTVAYLDENNGTLNCSGIPETFYYDEGGNLSFGNENCQHNNVGTNSFIGDCWNDGYDETFCYDCGTIINRIITNPAGHIYNDMGICDRCGNSIGGGEIIDDNIQMTEADFSMIGITVNDTADDLINKLVGQKFYVHYSQSGMVEMTVTADMIDVSEIPFGIEGGGNEGRINFYGKNGNPCTIHFYVTIMPDMSDVEYQIYKIANGDAMGLYELRVYANGYVLVTGDGMDNYPGNYIEAPFKENVILFDMDGGYLVFELGEGVADFYHPETELESIKTFYMSNEYMSLVMTAYGSYTGAGDYVTTMTATQLNPESGEEFTMTITTMLYLDMDSSVVRHVMFGERNYDEAGNMYCSHANVGVDSWEGNCWSDGYRSERCYDCGEQISYETIPAGHRYDENGYCPYCGNYEDGYVEIPDGIYQYIEKYLSAMCNEWNGIVMSYNVNEGQQALFNELTKIIKEATSYEQVDEIFHGQFRALCDEVMNNAGERVYLNHWELVPDTIHVTVGMSFDEFVAYFVENYSVNLYLSDGSIVNAPILYEMISFDGLDLSTVGTTDLSLFFTYEQHSIHFMLQVYVDPDMSNAKLLSSYTYAGPIENGMEWDTAELYDNGVAMLYRQGDVIDIVEYSLSDDGIFSYEMYGERIVYMISGDGVYCYASKDVIGGYTYSEDGDGCNITIFGEYTGEGEYYANIEMVEINSDGSYERYTATTVVILNMENREIYCGLIGGWMTFDDNGNVTPKECEHEEIDEKGYCAQCGRNMDESAPGDAVVTPSTPSVDSDYIYNENGSNDYTYTDKVVDGSYVVTYN